MAFVDPEGTEEAEKRAHEELVSLVGEERADDPLPAMELSLRATDLATLLNENRRLRAKVDELQEKGSKLVYRIQDQAYQLKELKKASGGSGGGTGGILTGSEILACVKSGAIQITPFAPDLLNPASYDLTLGSTVKVYRRWLQGSKFLPSSYVMDVRSQDSTQDVVSYHLDPYAGFVLHPGIGYLMHTVERIRTDRFVPVIDGKSSLGRLFMKVHETAGYGEPGFDGQYTLEVTVQHPLRIYPGMRIAQIRFHTLVGTITQYDGHYQGEHSVGPVESRVYTQFIEKK